ncbi:immunoglobulin I-set domain protein [Oesophagostomum dentatum]|uniref:Immunoglobulin I-set domain protein n=1 Tax=Oesophagostomum dentatum TaxID=61180 RepID=A0A0B1T5H8_OESDE|nr:immunoglobulin I-set domain protein [Oesophagostomum dentatum]
MDSHLCLRFWRENIALLTHFEKHSLPASVFHGSSLHLTKVNRKHMSEYVCVASNGIPPDETWTVKLLVTFPPLMQAKTPTVRVSPGALARLVCTAESWPRPDVTWDKDGQQIFDSDNYATSQTVSGQYHSVHVLEIRRVEKHHYGSYRCTARNDNGEHFADIDLEGRFSYQAEPNYLYTNAIQEDKDIDDESDGRGAAETQPVRSLSFGSLPMGVYTTPRTAEGMFPVTSLLHAVHLAVRSLAVVSGQLSLSM